MQYLLVTCNEEVALILHQTEAPDGKTAVRELEAWGRERGWIVGDPRSIGVSATILKLSRADSAKHKYSTTPPYETSIEICK